MLSVIVPAYKQGRTIEKDLRRISRVLQKTAYDYEIICVVDGKEDKTFERARRVRLRKVKVLGYQKNRGKGYAVRWGMERCRGKWVAFLDVGMEIDPNGIRMLWEHMKWYEADVVVGSKRHPVSVVNYPWERKILSWVYYWLIRLLFNFKIRDTQPGIKIFRREVLEKILPRLLVKQYAFDVEMLAVANRLGFKRIYEAPIKLDFQPDSLTTAATLRVIWRMLWDTMAVFYRLKILRYYD